jgi:ABC-2 type transport system ATP-binding protein
MKDAPPPGASPSVAGSASLVEAQGLEKRFGAVRAVDGISLRLDPGEVLGFVGPNGAGKTTTMRILAGLLMADAGEGHVLDHPLRADRREILRQVGYMPQRLALYGELSVTDNLRFRADVYGLGDPRGAVTRTIEEFGLGPYRMQKAERLSGGWARRLQLAATLIHRPRLILLDEPTAGLDAESRHEVWTRITRLAGQDRGVIINTHDLIEAEQCSRVALFSSGRLLASGPPDEVMRATPTRALLIDGPRAHDLAEPLERTPGVLAAYPQGRRLRVLAEPDAAEGVRAAIGALGASADPAPARFEDTAFVLVKRETSKAARR